MDITSITAADQPVAAKFEARSRPFTVGIDFAGSKVVTVDAETAAEAELKAKKIARDMFEQDCLIKAQE